MGTSGSQALSAEVETLTKSTFSLSLIFSVYAQMWNSKWKMSISSNYFFSFDSSFQWEVKMYSFASFMQFVRERKALHISAALQSARAGK